MPRARHPVRFIARTLKGAKPAPFPGFVPFCNPTLQSKLPAGARWLYEIKLDGYRAQLHRHTGQAHAFTRNGLDWTRQFAPLCHALAAVEASSIVLDGEVVVQGADGVPDFGAVRGAISRNPERLLYYAFDLLHLDGFDLRACALVDRRRVLGELIAASPGGRILMSETIDEPGTPPDALLRHACDLGFEGIVAKRADAPYRPGRSDDWIKVRCMRSLRFPIIGYVPAKGRSIAALRLGRREGKQLVYTGKVGTGFTARSAQTVRQRLEPLMRKTPPVAKPLRKKDTVWVEPQIEALVEFRGMTEDGMLRHPSFKGLDLVMVTAPKPPGTRARIRSRSPRRRSNMRGRKRVGFVLPSEKGR